MNHPSPDRELMASYASRGSEAAFQALIDRHVDLVYSTAFRQLGDVGLAEETTQNVFVALARKSGSLGGLESIAGWLHRCAVLEAKARLRSELRRKRREEIAAAVMASLHEGEPRFSALYPLLDEALFDLRDRDRLALVLRFFEDRSLRDVGVALGVDEDAARKRVSRALDQVAEFFRNRGFAVSSATAVALFANATSAAPMGLAAVSTTVGLAAGAGPCGLGGHLLDLMTLTKTQTVLLCTTLAVVPLAMQWQTQNSLNRSVQILQSQLGDASQNLANTEAELERARLAARALALGSAAQQARLNSPNPPAASRAEVYRWDEKSPMFRVPKQALSEIRNIAGILGVNGTWRVNSALRELLQLTPDQSQAVQAAIDRFIKDGQTLQAGTLRRISPEEADLDGRTSEEVRAFAVDDIRPRILDIRQSLIDELTDRLGAERFELLKAVLKDWVPLDANQENVTVALMEREHKLVFYKPIPGNHRVFRRIVCGEKFSGISLRTTDIPEFLRPQIEDWIQIAENPSTQGAQ